MYFMDIVEEEKELAREEGIIEGKEIGHNEGLQEGKELGIKEGLLQVINIKLAKNMPIEQIAEVLEKPKEYIMELIENSKL